MTATRTRTIETRSAFPLDWPRGWPRSPERGRALYQVSFAKARDELFADLRRLGASDVVLSTNAKLRGDGLPYADYREPGDPGVAVFWTSRDGKPMVMACDRYQTVRENLRAIGLTVEALRAIERAGASDLLERAFSGFAALPASTESRRPWREVLGFAPDARNLDREDVEEAFRERARSRHPDAGGSHDEMVELTRARADALVEVG